MRALAAGLERRADRLAEQWSASLPFRHFVVDDLLPADLAREIHASLPAPEPLFRRSSLRERKRVGVAIDEYAPIVREALLSFQAPAVLRAVGAIVSSAAIQPDPTFYASGLSVMTRGDFLNPHIDNSHDGDQRLHRVLNLLYYASPGWRAEWGGSLELWDPERRRAQRIPCAFNRLVVMATHRRSWHSVDPVRGSGLRWCLSNYYFAPEPLEGRGHRHVTTFRGRPEQPLRDALLRVDGVVRNAAGRALPFLLRRTPHRRAAGS